MNKKTVQTTIVTPLVLLIGFLVSGRMAMAHGISEESRQTMSDGSTLDYVWLGAEHMVTGYDHLLFLFGVIFFLTSFRDIVRFITAFTVGHCITLLGATMMGITANAYIVDAVIALSVIYKGFENLDGFKKVLKFDAPNLVTMVFIFGLIHGFGLSTRLQELTLGQDGLVARILAFNVGVELGQIAALSLMLGFFTACRQSRLFSRFSATANGLLIAAGFGLFWLQVDGYLHDQDHHGHHSHQKTQQDAGQPSVGSPPATKVVPPPATGSDAPNTGANQNPGDRSADNTETKHTEGPEANHPMESKAKEDSKKSGDHSHGHTHTHGKGKPHTH